MTQLRYTDIPIEISIDKYDIGEINSPIVGLDIEHDEKENFVGLAIAFNKKQVVYYSKRDILGASAWNTWQFIGHNIKSDLRILKKWGVNVSPHQIYYDSMIASYVQNATKPSHGLKILAKEKMGWDWPSYADLVGKGKNKKTLDNHTVEEVAHYCAMDAVAPLYLKAIFDQVLTEKQKEILYDFDLPINRLLMEMETAGIYIDINRLQNLDHQFTTVLQECIVGLEKESAKVGGWSKRTPSAKEWVCQNGFNIASSQQVLRLLHANKVYPRLNIKNKETRKKEEKDTVDKKALLKYKDNGVVQQLLKFSEYKALLTKVTRPFLALGTLPKVYTTWGQISRSEKGITTGRLCSYDPVNLMNIPARTEDGMRCKEIFIPAPGNVFICADLGQADLRVLAHESKEPFFVQAFKTGEDLHTKTACLAFDKPEVTKEERFIGKTLNLAIANGSGAWNLSETLGLSYEKAEYLYAKFWDGVPVLKRWKERRLQQAREAGGIENWAGWFVPVANLNSNIKSLRGYAERQAMSIVFQGGTAALIKLIMLNCAKAGYVPRAQVHDELLFEVKDDGVPQSVDQIRHLMTTSVQWVVPITVDIRAGHNWKEAKP